MGRGEAGAAGSPGVGIFAENQRKHKIHKIWAVAPFPVYPYSEIFVADGSKWMMLRSVK